MSEAGEVTGFMSGITPDWIEGWSITKLIEGKLVINLPYAHDGKTQYVFEDQPGLYELLVGLFTSLQQKPTT